MNWQREDTFGGCINRHKGLGLFGQWIVTMLLTREKRNGSEI